MRGRYLVSGQRAVGGGRREAGGGRREALPLTPRSTANPLGQTVHPSFGKYRDHSGWWQPTAFNHTVRCAVRRTHPAEGKQTCRIVSPEPIFSLGAFSPARQRTFL